jgi:hypothetical protein
VVASGPYVLVTRPDGALTARRLDDPVHALVRSEEGSNPFVLVGMPSGCLLLDVLDERRECPRLAGDLDTPTLGWSRHGVAIAVDRHSIWLMRPGSSGPGDPPLQRYAHGKPWAILPSADPAVVHIFNQQASTVVRIVG